MRADGPQCGTAGLQRQERSHGHEDRDQHKRDPHKLALAQVGGECVEWLHQFGEEVVAAAGVGVPVEVRVLLVAPPGPAGVAL